MPYDPRPIAPLALTALLAAVPASAIGSITTDQVGGFGLADAYIDYGFGGIDDIASSSSSLSGGTLSVSVGGSSDGGSADVDVDLAVTAPAGSGAGPFMPGDEVLRYDVIGSTSGSVTGGDDSDGTFFVNPLGVVHIKFTLTEVYQYQVTGDLNSIATGNGETAKDVSLGTVDDPYSILDIAFDPTMLLAVDQTGLLGPGTYIFSVAVDDLAQASGGFGLGDGQEATIETAIDLSLIFSLVPEPTAVAMLLVPGALLLRRRR